MKTQQIFALQFRRLPRLDDAPGLVLLTIDISNGVGPLRRVGLLTDVALRGRLGHYDLHSANELAAIRQALQTAGGKVTVLEGWSGLSSCLKFWQGFTGSQIRPVEWTCERCSVLHRDDVGASVGETYSRACRCGKIERVTATSRPPDPPAATVAAKKPGERDALVR
ncbi:MAG TPA: hypothetical protein VMN82_08370 [Thermoanaerobaculia bacterium]|nr:hypothetical protein [Thermoanaerobaculia bacterium]